MLKRWQTWVPILVLVGVASGFLIGRSTAPVHDRGFANGNAAGYAEGVAVGRALQIGDTVPKASQSVATAAFQAGYRAGATDSFDAYDGGWRLGFPYLIVLDEGVGDTPYRFASRDELTPGTTYRLCPDGKTVCQS
jgi:hypothetical protein